MLCPIDCVPFRTTYLPSESQRAIEIDFAQFRVTYLSSGSGIHNHLITLQKNKEDINLSVNHAGLHSVKHCVNNPINHSMLLAANHCDNH